MQYITTARKEKENEIIKAHLDAERENMEENKKVNMNATYSDRNLKYNYIEITRTHKITTYNRNINNMVLFTI